MYSFFEHFPLPWRLLVVCPRSDEFVVSPRPDVYIHSLNAKVKMLIIIASDGLWNVMSPKEVVKFIWDYEHIPEDMLHQPRDVSWTVSILS